MILNNYLTIRECDGPAWIKRNDEGLIEHVFQMDGEVILLFDQKSFEKFVAIVDEFQKTGKTVKSVNANIQDEGRSESDLSLDMKEEEVRFNVELLGSLGEDKIGPDLIIAGKDFKLSLGFNLDQTREIKERLEQVISILEGLKKVQTEKTVPAQSA